MSGRGASHTRIGILGGSFDPPHNAHKMIIRRAMRTLRLDTLILIPAAIPPHKLSKKLTSKTRRLAMLTLFAHNMAGCTISDIELRRKGVSYTIDTIRTLRRRFPMAEFSLIIGSDNLHIFHSWKGAADLVRMCRLVVVPRPGYPVSRRLRTMWKPRVLRGKAVDLSSSWIRERVRQRRSIRSVVPREVEDFIRDHSLYGTGNKNGRSSEIK